MKIVFTLLLLVGLSQASAQQPISLTSEEKLKIQILNLQYTLRAEQEKNAQLTISYGVCQAQLLKDSSQLSAEEVKLQKEIENNHPDYSFNIRTGEFKKKENPQKE